MPLLLPLTALRRIKRSKKSSADNDDAEEEEEEEEDDGDMDDDDEDEQEVCPQGCDKGQYVKVCALREKRLDEEDRIQEFTKSVEVHKKVGGSSCISSFIPNGLIEWMSGRND